MTACVSLAWGPGQRLLTASRGYPSITLSSWSPSSSFLRLVFQGHLHFMSHAPALQRSREYRASMLECLSELDPESSDASQLREAITVWSFIEAVYLVDPALDGAHISARLADWYLLNFPELREDARDYLGRSTEPENSEEEDRFWKIVARLAAVGSRGLASRLISARIARSGFDEDWATTAGAAAPRTMDGSDISHHSPLSIADAMLAECPAETDNSIAARGDPSWLEWQDTCEAWADEQGKDQDSRLSLLLRVLSGNVDYMARACISWEEMLVASITYARHLVSDTRHEHSVAEVENACVEVSAVFEAPRARAGGALLDAALGQPAEAIIRLGASMDTTWYAAHLCDLLMQAKQLSPEDGRNLAPMSGNVSLLEHLILSFTRKLEGSRGMWRVAADYYTQCPQKGRQELSDMLVSICSDGPVDPNLEKIMTFCFENEMTDVISTVCAQVGTACVHSQNLGGAMFWFARGNILDRVFGTVEAGIANAEECGCGSIASRTLAQIIGAATTAQASDAAMEGIAYARTYVEFQDAVASLHDTEDEELADNTFEVAEKSAVRLICAGGLPRKFWTVVIYEMCHLIDTRKAYAVKLSTDTVYEFLGALEVTGDSKRSPRLLDGLYNRVNWKKVHGDGVKHRATEGSYRRKPQDELIMAADIDPVLRKMRETLLHAITCSVASNL